MTASTPTRTHLARAAAPLLLALALAGCASSGGGSTETKSPSASASASAAADCTDAQVTVVVEYGTLKGDPVHACAEPGVASDVLKDAGITTEGTADYGDQVICRVDDKPSKADESCATLPSSAYWAMWVKTDAATDWAYAQEGVATQQLTAGQSLGLVYTEGDDSTPPKG